MNKCFGNGLKDQRGGIAILTALGFLLFSVPLITASLDLAQASAIDARVKSEITHRQYCGLAVREYLNFLTLDKARWGDWLSDNVDPVDPTGATAKETIAPCGNTITITVVQQSALPPGSTDDPIDDPQNSGVDTYSVPGISVFDDRRFQTTKSVSDSNPVGGSSVAYTITIVNKGDDARDLEKIVDILPDGFNYDCNAPANQLTLPDTAAQVLLPKDHEDRCVEGDNTKLEIEWELPDDTSIPSGRTVTLVFNAVTPFTAGTYCNHAEVVPGGDKTSNGKTAPVQIGVISGPCTGDSVIVTKTVDSATLVSTNTTTNPYTYTFDIDYTMTLENVGTRNLTIKELVDYLPVGFSYVSTSPEGDITGVPENTEQVVEIDRQRVKWKPEPEVAFNSGDTKTLKFSTTAAITRGDYLSDLVVEFGDGLYSADRYTWPTALVSVKDVYDVTATDEEGNQQLISLQVWISDELGVVHAWNLQ